MSMDKLPNETLIKLFKFLDTSSLVSMATTSSRMNGAAETVLYETIDMTALQALDEPTRAKFISAVSRSLVGEQDSKGFPSQLARRKAVRHLKLHVAKIEDRGHLDEMLRHLRGLRSLEINLPESLVQIPFPGKFMFWADPRLRPFRLTRFVWNQRERRSKEEMDFFRRFLESQPTIEHLELSKTKFVVPQLSSTALPNLKTLCASPASVIRLLPGRRVEHLRTKFKDTLSVHRFKQEDVASIRVLSCSISTMDGFDVFISSLKNLESLDIDHVYYKISVAEILEPFLDSAIVAEKIRRVRFRDIWSYDIPELFSAQESLVCVESLMHPVPYGPSPSTFLRWRRGKPQPLHVEWSCDEDEKWLNEWEG